jgi:hypothetical protein
MGKKVTQIDIMTNEHTKSYAQNESFAKQEIQLQNTPLFFPEGFEKIFLFIYATVLPYITGLIFTFVYLAKSDYDLFLSLNKETPVFLTWAIGYEILAALILIYVVKMAISFSINASKKGPTKNFRRPT